MWVYLPSTNFINYTPKGLSKKHFQILSNVEVYQKSSHRAVNGNGLLLNTLPIIGQTGHLKSSHRAVNAMKLHNPYQS